MFRPPTSANCNWPRTLANDCLDQQTVLWKQILAAGGLAYLCPGHKYDVPPWVKMPPQGKLFMKLGRLDLPAADGIDHEIPFQQGEFYVPDGYDGAIRTVVFQYTGQGFNEASGDLTWRIKINQRYAKDYSNVVTQMGSLTNPVGPNAGAILVQSHDNIQVIINRSVASAGNLNGGKVIGSLFGWTWPR